MTVEAGKLNAPVGYVGLVRNNEKFRLLWIGQIISLLGDWFDLIASAALIAQLTESGAAIGGLFVVRMLAPFLISPIAGVAADRYNRKVLLIVTDILRGVIVLGFLFVRSADQIWLIYVITAIQMGLSAFFFPARSAILADITQPNELGTANALSGTTWSVMLSFGAALGGLSSGVLGIYPSFVIDAATFFLSAVFISRMIYQPSPELQQTEKTIAAALRQYVDGLTYLRRHVDILIIALHKAANALFVRGVFQVLQVTIAEQIFVIGEGGGISLGLIYAAVGVGTGIGPLLARRLTGDNDRPLRNAIVVSYLLSALGLVLVATLNDFTMVLIGSLLSGVGTGISWVFSTQLLLEHTPGEVQGRVFSTEFMLFTLMSAIASGAGGALLDGGASVSGLLMWLAGLTLLPGALWAVWINIHKPAEAH